MSGIAFKVQIARPLDLVIFQPRSLALGNDNHFLIGIYALATEAYLLNHVATIAFQLVVVS